MTQASLVRDAALRLSQLGYFVIPVHPSTKCAVSKVWTQQRLTPPDIPLQFKDNNVGLLLGVELQPKVFLVAIDIDVNDQLLVDRIRQAFPTVPPCKFGRKGATFIARMDSSIKKRILRRKDPMGGSTGVVEILAAGQQTVIPPSMHPSGKPYEWVGPPLDQFDPGDLPVLTPSIMMEVETAVKNEHSPIFLLNEMEYMGPGGGGTVHNSVLTAVASMVANGWPDDDVWSRVDLACARTISDYDTWHTWEHQVRRMIEDAKAKGFTKKKKEDPIVLAARWLVRDWKSPNSYNRDGQLSVYQEGHYRLYTNQETRHAVANEWKEPDGVSMHHGDWTMVSRTALDIVPAFTVQSSKRVCLTNGTYDMDTGALLPWSPDDFLISQLPFQYDPDAKCPVYERFLDETFAGQPDADVSIACYEEYVAHTLFECLDYHRFLVIKGQPRTGKSTLVNVAKLMHGPRAISAVPVHEFGNERYRTSMAGKLLNVVGEVAVTSHAADDFLKAVTAGDEIQIRYLYGEPMLVRLPTRLIIACNELFRIKDTSGAVEERMLVISCDNYRDPHARDVTLFGKMRAEAPGIFNRIVRSWPRLQARGYFAQPQSQDEVVSEFSRENNHALAWYLERTHQGMVQQYPGHAPAPDDPFTENSDLYIDYTTWSMANGFKQMSSVSFGTKLNQIPNFVAKTKLKWLPGGRVIRGRPLTLTSDARY